MDMHRPIYHFLPPANWMNDPNGLIQWQGVYHLFYQHNPTNPNWGPMHWGHASAPDLVHWSHLPIALAPEEGGLDHSGVWSGSAVDWNGTPALIYTARDDDREHVCVSTSRDGLRTWQRYPGNPVIAEPPSGLETIGFRDPYIWRDEEGWKLVLGSGAAGIGGMVLLYQSSDLVTWEYLGPLLRGDSSQREPLWTGDMWECPNFFQLGDRWVLLISAMGVHPSRSLYTLCFTGTLDGRVFTPQSLSKMDGGDVYFYAPQTFRDEQGRRIAFGWSREARSQEVVNDAGWAGVLTMPRLMTLTADGCPCYTPAPEVEKLRGTAKTWVDLRIAPEDDTEVQIALEEFASTAVDLEGVFALDARQAGECGLLVCRSPQGEEQLKIGYEIETRQLVVDTRRASTSESAAPGVYTCPLDLRDGEKLHLRVLIDQSIIEVFANQRAVITARFYPTRRDSTGMALFARGQEVCLESLTAWEMGLER